MSEPTPGSPARTISASPQRPATLLGGIIWIFLFVLGLSGAAAGDEMPRYDHIFVVIAENKGYGEIIGAPGSAAARNAPRLNGFAAAYGLATAFYGEVHPSEGNYLAILGGDTFGIHSDDAFYCQPGQPAPFCEDMLRPGHASHSVGARSLMDQLDEAGLSWKGYFEDLPAPGSLVIYDPSEERPDASRPFYLYAAKHNGFLNFERVRQDPRLPEKILPIHRLEADLDSGTLPNFAEIVLNECNEMHGLWPNLPPASAPAPEDCVLYRATDARAGAALASVIHRGDKAIGAVADRIMASEAWRRPGNFAIVITFDEDDQDTTGTQGCCGFDPDSLANFGGGHIATIVITNHGPRGAEDPTPYNHYSLLRSIEEAFGIHEHLGFAAASGKGVKAMAPLFATRGD